MPTILIADDDTKLTKMLSRMLAYEGYRVLTATDGWDALAQAEAHHPDLVVLDWMMPHLDGLEVARRLRASSPTPILMLTARGAIADRVEGLDSGADDYLVKPFAPAEFLARVRARLRQTHSADPMQPLTYAGLSLDPLTRETRRGDRQFSLSPKEFDLLAYLMRNAGRVLTKGQIVDHVWGYDNEASSNIVEIYIHYLRDKIDRDFARPLIRTVRGVGYTIKE